MAAQPPRILAPGDSIGDGYVIEAFLAGGGMGQVYVARDPRLDRRVAVKLMHAETATSSVADSRFQREARALSRVVHPNVVAIHAFGRTGDGWYLIMEFIDGDTLDGLLRKQRPTVDESLLIARQVAAGLAEAHALGIVHRDIKPGNILLQRLASGGNLAKIVDFGLARAQEPGNEPQLTREAAILGTPLYMSPEQIQGQALDGRSDLYSLGVVLYQLLTGRLPHFRDSIQGILMAHLLDEPAPLTFPGSASMLPEGLQAEVLRALAKDPAQRHANMQVFADALERFGGPVAAASVATVTTCPGCAEPVAEAGGYCKSCGSVVPLPACPACGAARDGERYTCVDCNASLLTPPRRHGAQLVTATDARPTQPAGTLARANAPSQLVARTAVVVVAHLESEVATEQLRADFAELFVSVIEREGGRPMAILGDDAIGVFGLGGLREGETEAAVDAALRLMSMFKTMPANLLDGVTLRIGIDVGPVQSRGLGVTFGTAFAGGATVERTRAAAIAAPAGSVVLGETALCEVRVVYDVRRRDVGDDASCAVVERRRDSARSLGAYVGQSAGVRLVARETERMMLTRASKRVLRSDCLVAVPVMGEAGSGKSRLVSEFLQQLGDEGERWQLDIGACSALGLPVAYEPLVELVRARVRAHEASDDDDLRARLQRLPGLAAEASVPAEVAQRRLRTLLRMLGLHATDGEASVRPATDAEQQAAFEAFSHLIRASCAIAPVVLVIEAMQWAKGPTLELIAHLARTCDDVPLLLIPILRSDRADAVLAALALPAARTTPIDLGPLEIDEVGTLVEALRPGAQVPEPLVEAIAALSDGLPGQIEAVVLALTEDGCFEHAGDHWHVDVKRATAAAKGRSLGDLVLQRINRMAPNERGLIEALAAAGPAAPRGVLAAMLGREPSEREFDAAKQQRLLVEVRSPQFRGQRAFTLRQAQVGDVVLGALPVALRAELHRRAARWLLDWREPRPAGFGALLAHHFMVAGDEAEATRCVVQNAEASLRAMANRDAYDAYTAAVELAAGWVDKRPDDVEAKRVWVAALLSVAELGLRLGETTVALEASERADAIAAQRDDVLGDLRVRALILRGDTLRASGSYDEAIQALAAAATLSRRRDGEGAVQAVLAMAVSGGVLIRRGNYEGAEALSRDVLSRVDTDAVGASDAVLHSALGRLHTWIGHACARRLAFDDADAHYRAARNHLGRADDEYAVAMAELSIGNLFYRRAELEKAAEIYSAVAESCGRLDFLQGKATAQTNLAHVLIDQQRFQEALTALREAEQALRRAASHDALPETLRLIGTALLAMGDLNGARQSAQEAYTIASAMGNLTLAAASQEIAREAETQTEMLSARTALQETAWGD